MLVFYEKLMLFIVSIILCILKVGGTEDYLVKEWKCVNRDCSAPISSGITIIPYPSPDHKRKLTFKVNESVKILRKSNENGKDLLWISLNEKEGYVASNFIRETQVLSSTLINVKQQDLVKRNEPISPTPSYQVIDGTTLYDPSETPISSQNGNEKSNDEIEVNTDKDEKEVEKDQNKVNDSPTSEAKPILSEVRNITSVNSTTTETLPSINNSQENEHDQLKYVDTTEPSSPHNSISDLSNFKSELNLTKNHSYAHRENVSFDVTTVENDSKGVAVSAEEPQINPSSSLEISEKKNDSDSQENKTNLETTVNEIVDTSKINYIADNNVKTESVPSSSQTPIKDIGALETAGIDEEKLKSEGTVPKAVNIENTQSNEKTIEADINENVLSPPPVNNTVIDQNSPSKVEVLVMANKTITGEVELAATKPNEPNNPEFDSNVNESVTVNQYENNSSDSLEMKQIPPIHNKNLDLQSKESTKVVVEQFPTESTTNKVPVSHLNFIVSPKPINNVEPNEVTEPTLKVPLENIPSEKIEGNLFPSSEYINENISASPEEVNGDSSLPEEIKEDSTSPQEKYINESSSPSSVEINEYSTEFSEEIIEISPSTKGIKEISTPLEEINEHSTRPPNDNNENSSTINDIEENLTPSLDEINEDFSAPSEDNNDDSSLSWYSSISSLMDSLKELYSSTVGPSSQISDGEALLEETVESSFTDECENEREISGNYCQKKELDDSQIPSIRRSENFLESDVPEISAKDSYNPWTSVKSVLLIITAPLLIICFTLGFYYFENLRRDDELVKKNNILSSELFVLETEKATIEDQLITLKDDLQKIIEEKGAIDNELIGIKDELNKTKAEKINIEDRESKLEKKLAMVEQNYNELRKIFSESKTKGDRSTLIADIKKLRESIAADRVEISSLKEELQEKKHEIKQLTSDYQKVNEAKLSLQERFDKLVVEGQEIAKGYQETLAKMEQTIEENKEVQSKLEDNLTKHKKRCESLLIEKELAESALQKAHGVTSSESLAEWQEVKEVRAELMLAQKQVTELTKDKDRLSIQFESAERKVKSLTTEVSQLNEMYENAEKEKIEALTKLQVLSNYFKEKETQLQEELGLKESQWLQKQSEDSTIYQQMRDLREDNVHLKNMIETLKKEIIDQETSFKKIINTTEQKAQENWVSFRRAENRLKEVLAEAAQLRNRLTTLETSDNPDVSGLEVNGDLPSLSSAMSPPFMLHPNEFIPPPPLVPLPQVGNPSSRPPPLGRISSPPLVSGDFIPPPPLIHPYDVYSHPHQNPPSPSHLPPPLHKPQPRDRPPIQPNSQIPRRQKDSQSSNQSSESLHDKTLGRRSKR